MRTYIIYDNMYIYNTQNLIETLDLDRSAQKMRPPMEEGISPTPTCSGLGCPFHGDHGRQGLEPSCDFLLSKPPVKFAFQLWFMDVYGRVLVDLS